MIKPKPWWLFFNKDPRWITISNIYAPAIYFEDPTNSKWIPRVKHEEVHVKQQNNTGLFVWVFKYLTNSTFRLEQECEGIAEELYYTPANERYAIYEMYITSLCNSDYMNAASSVNQASSTILKACITRGFTLTFTA